MNAYLNHGRWVVDCSSGDCQAVLFADRSVCECRDQSICDHPTTPCGTPIVVMFPDDRVSIDRVMSRRPRRNRNWDVESVAELKAENLLQGVGI